jgi:hypothetical protein
MFITDEKFELITDEKVLRELGFTLTDWRHKFVNLIVGHGPNLCGGGRIRIEFPCGHIQKIRTNNLSQRLDDIIRQLMMPPNRICKDTWIRKLKAGRQQYTMREIRELKIQVRED